MQKRNGSSFPRLAAAVVLLVMFLVPVFTGFGCGDPTKEEEGNTLSAEETTLHKQNKPPIDQHIPEVLETATFALG